MRERELEGRGVRCPPEGTEPSGRAGGREGAPVRGIKDGPAVPSRTAIYLGGHLPPSLFPFFLPSFPEPVVSAEREWSPPGPSLEKLSAATRAR